MTIILYDKVCFFHCHNTPPHFSTKKENRQVAIHGYCYSKSCYQERLWKITLYDDGCTSLLALAASKEQARKRIGRARSHGDITTWDQISWQQRSWGCPASWRGSPFPSLACSTQTWACPPSAGQAEDFWKLRGIASHSYKHWETLQFPETMTWRWFSLKTN